MLFLVCCRTVDSTLTPALPVLSVAERNRRASICPFEVSFGRRTGEGVTGRNRVEGLKFAGLKVDDCNFLINYRSPFLEGLNSSSPRL